MIIDRCIVSLVLLEIGPYRRKYTEETSGSSDEAEEYPSL